MKQAKTALLTSNDDEGSAPSQPQFVVPDLADFEPDDYDDNGGGTQGRGDALSFELDDKLDPLDFGNVHDDDGFVAASDLVRSDTGPDFEAGSSRISSVKSGKIIDLDPDSDDNAFEFEIEPPTPDAVERPQSRSSLSGRSLPEVSTTARRSHVLGSSPPRAASRDLPKFISIRALAGRWNRPRMDLPFDAVVPTIPSPPPRRREPSSSPPLAPPPSAPAGSNFFSNVAPRRVGLPRKSFKPPFKGDGGPPPQSLFSSQPPQRPVSAPSTQASSSYRRLPLELASSRTGKERQQTIDLSSDIEAAQEEEQGNEVVAITAPAARRGRRKISQREMVVMEDEPEESAPPRKKKRKKDKERSSSALLCHFSLSGTG